MKRNEFFAVCLTLFAVLGAVVVVSSVILGGYGLILSGSVVALLLGGSADQDRTTESRNA